MIMDGYSEVRKYCLVACQIILWITTPLELYTVSHKCKWGFVLDMEEHCPKKVLKCTRNAICSFSLVAKIATSYWAQFLNISPLICGHILIHKNKTITKISQFQYNDLERIVDNYCAVYLFTYRLNFDLKFNFLSNQFCWI